MTRFRNRIAVWSSLHELVLIYESSNGSVFELLVYQVHNEHISGSDPGLQQRSGSHQMNQKRCSTQPIHTNKYKCTLNTYMCIRTYTRIPTYTCIYTYKHILTYIYTCLNTNTHACPLNTHAHNHHAHATTIIHIIMHTCSRNI